MKINEKKYVLEVLELIDNVYDELDKAYGINCVDGNDLRNTLINTISDKYLGLK